jgi:hypothetical protein
MVGMGGYEFNGPYTDASEIGLRQGVYAVACLVDDALHCLLDIGTAGQLRTRLSSHRNRQVC